MRSYPTYFATALSKHFGFLLKSNTWFCPRQGLQSEKWVLGTSRKSDCKKAIPAPLSFFVPWCTSTSYNLQLEEPGLKGTTLSFHLDHDKYSKSHFQIILNQTTSLRTHTGLDISFPRNSLTGCRECLLQIPQPFNSLQISAQALLRRKDERTVSCRKYISLEIKETLEWFLVKSWQRWLGLDAQAFRARCVWIPSLAFLPLSGPKRVDWHSLTLQPTKVHW